jgi:WD40 repeat protein/predicted Ser/Thr protein kinase
MARADNGEELPPFEVPGVNLCEELARGGVGIVFRAEQAEPRRTLAVKILQPQWARSQAVRGRFRREAQAMAALEHPAILPIYEVGVSDDLPWFTMKLATGGSLAERIARYRGNWKACAELIAALAEALFFAHERGVLHRDLKPGNVLFDGEGRAYLGDFGVAKQVAMVEPNHTLPSDVLGTPHYLPPEVAIGGTREATIAGDIYSLGAILYELLACRLPYTAEGLPALLRQIADTTPLPLKAAHPRPPRDLAAICERAMEKDPRHRYATAGELANDLRSYLSAQPIKARPLGRLASTWRWGRQHPITALLAASVLVLLLIVGGGALAANLRIRDAQRESAQHARERMLAQAASIRLARQPGFRDDALDLIRSAATPEESDAFRVQRRSEVMAALAYPTMARETPPEPPSPGMQFAAASPNWKFIAWYHPGKSRWQVTQASDGKLISTGFGSGRPEYLGDDGKLLATQEHHEHWQLWRVGSPIASVASEGAGVVQDISADGRRFAWNFENRSGSRIAQVRENATGRITMRVEYPNVPVGMKLSPDGEFCAVAPSIYSPDSTVAYSVRVYRCSDGILMRELTSALANCVWCLAWSPDGRSLLAAERDGPVYIWDVTSGNVRHLLRGTGTQIWRAAFSPDGQRLAALSSDRVFSLFDLANGRPLVQGIAWLWQNTIPRWQSNDRFGPVSMDGKAVMLRFQPGVFDAHQAPDLHSGVLGIATSPDPRWTVLGDARHAWLWDHQERKARPPFASGLWNSFCFSPDGLWLYGAGEEGVKRWRFHNGDITEDGSLSKRGFHNVVALNQSGQILALEREQSAVANVIRQPESAQSKAVSFGPTPGRWLDLSADGTMLASGGSRGVKVWQVENGSLLHETSQGTDEIRFSPDGRWLLVARKSYEIWSTKTWQREHVLAPPDFSNVSCKTTFHPRKPLLATASPLGRICLWSTDHWKLLGTLENPNELPVRRMTFDGRGAQLQFGSSAGIFGIWDFQRLEEELKQRQLAW